MSDEPSCSNVLDPQLPRCAWLLACSVSRKDASPQSSASARRIPVRILSGNGVHRFRNHCSTSPEYANAYFRWLRRPNAWDVDPKSDCIPLSEPASRKRITPFPPNCVHQAPDAERLHQEALLNAINPLKSLSTASSLPRKSRFSATVLLMALSIAGSNMEKSTLNCWYSASIESYSCNPLR